MESLNQTSTTRFSDRVDDYVKYRPEYPQQLIILLQKNVFLNNDSIIADIGAGTGISTKLFLENGWKVYAVEPNTPMREAAELSFTGYKNYKSIDGSAEHTTLPEHSIDVVFSAQAFHWFELSKTKIELNRILKTSGHIVLVWNLRSEKNDFQRDYEKLLKRLPEYSDATQKNITDVIIEDFFSPRIMHKEYLKNAQQLSLEGLKGRTRSSSYVPKSGDDYENLISELEILFSKYEKNGVVEFEYETIVYWC